MPVIDVADLRKVYGERTVVDGVSFSVEQGEIFGVLGPNGAGKTTMVECIGGLRRRDGGSIRVAGLDPAEEGVAFRSALGIELPRVSRQMAASGEKVDRDSLSAGDLVFFSRRGKRVDHVGIYLGNGRFVHAPRTGKDVMVSSLDDGYWGRKFMQARRVPGV